ncbi:MAG: catalase family peroxidase [Actinobacteria bacterium]|nr:MAG: catalase family peroxidase [Actinomycetota bacterium]
MAGGDLYEQIVDAANALYGTHDGSRALHAKGTWCAGTFTATPEAAELCRAAHLQGQPTPAVIRFSNASGDPHSDDWQRDSHGMAVRLRPDGGDEADILAVTTPAFVLRTPEEFLEFMRLRKPDPETGQPDWEKLGAFFGEHPESQTAVQATLNSEPPASFATLVYQSPHAFRFLAADGSATWVRYRWRPEAGEATLPDDEAKAKGGDYLRAELAERLGEGPVAFDLKLQIPVEDDPLDDPTAVWPEDRERVVAGRLEITEIVDDPERGDHIEVFDPTRTGDAIELSDDRILHARARAYSVSAYRRLGMDVENPSTPPSH